MTDKVKFSSYVKNNFKTTLNQLAKNKSKADNSYHTKYITVNEYLNSFNDKALNSICKKISNFKYNCDHLTPIILPKTNCLNVMSLDNTRLVCVPSVQDRVLQKLFLDYLKKYYGEIYDRFCEYDHALNKDIHKKEIDTTNKNGQPTKKTIHGIRKALDDVIEYRSKYKYVIKADIVKFFDNINREIALKKFEKEFIGLDEDRELTAIFKSFIYCDAKLDYGDLKYKKLIEKYLEELKGKGVRQGMPIASLCSSMYLYEFDNLMVKNNIPYIRYADDFLIFDNSYSKAKKIKEHVQKNLKNIGLDIEKGVGKPKTKIYGARGKFTYLGFDIVYNARLQSYQRRIPRPVFDKAIGRINSFQSMTKVKRECGNYVDFSLYLRILISGYTNFYNKDLAINGAKFERDLIAASKNVRKKLITDNLNIDFEDIGSANKRMFFFGIK
ncbi:reverse transcriptase domain-containing protein [uncultured Psychrobacter sp.]|uniref:reverse transcriptase domain-containing protein n=2 Tax=Psychrobacter TaxID=497 RepID=UPI002596BB70|nr:reverse transcriptase domain-containing protein [uncultured Psychrobacter sp.]